MIYKNNPVFLFWTVLGLSAAWIAPVVSAWLRQRKIDWLSPKLFFAGIYLITSLALPINYYWVDKNLTYIPFKLVEANISGYLLLVILGYLGLQAGIYLARLRVKRKKVKNIEDEKNNGLPWGRIKTIGGAFLIISILSIAVSSFWKIRGYQTGETLYLQDQFSYGWTYYFYILGLNLFYPSLIVVASANGITINKLFTPFLICILALFFLFAILSGTRNQILETTLILLLIRNYFVQRFKFKELLLFLPVFVILIIGILFYRVYSFSFANSLLAIQKTIFSIAPYSKVLFDIGSTAFITTHIMEWFPAHFSFLYGRSYLDAIPNLLPGFLFGGSINRPFINAAFLFKNIYEGFFFNPNQGYGFSLIGEAYLNFGTLGSLIVLGILGWVFESLYQNALKSNIYHLEKWLYYFAIYYKFFYGLRSESVSIVKQLFYGVTIIFIFQIITRLPLRLKKISLRFQDPVNAAQR
jgi:oligosaccharide repeat unit polymerase